MQVSVEKTGDLERRMTVQVPEDSIEGQINSRLGELRRQVRLKGFRPGKVPMNVIRQRYGQQIRQEVLQEVMQASLQEAIGQQGLRVAGVTRIEPRPGSEDSGLEFTAELEVFPDLPEMDLSGLEIERLEAEVAESDVDDMIQTLREQRRKWRPAERPSEAGDRVRAEYVAMLGEQRVPEAGRHEIAPVLGASSHFPALDEALTGVEPGDEKTLELSFPDDYRDAALAGNTAEVSLKVSAVETSSMPEVDDDFAASFGVEGGVDQLRQDVRRNLERELRNATGNRLKQAVTDGLLEQFSELKIPDSAIVQEARQLQSQVQQQSGQDEPLPLEQFRESAEKRVRLGLVMGELARHHAVSVDEARIQQKIEELADTYEQPAQVIELYRSNEQLMDSVRNMVLEEQVVELVIDKAAVNSRSVSFKEAMEQA